MSDPFDELTEEHRAAVAFLDELRQWMDQMDDERAARSGANPYRAAELTRRLRDFDAELEQHFRKEEEALFPMMEPHIPRDGGPIGVMLDEHVRLRALRARALSLAPGAEEGTAVEPFERAATELDDLLRNHIAKEDNILFPLGRSVLSAAELGEARRRMDALSIAA